MSITINFLHSHLHFYAYVLSLMSRTMQKACESSTGSFDKITERWGHKKEINEGYALRHGSQQGPTANLEGECGASFNSLKTYFRHNTKLGSFYIILLISTLFHITTN